MSSDIRVLPQDDSGPSVLGWLYSLFIDGSQGGSQEMASDSTVDEDLNYPPLDVLPCANVSVNGNFACEKPGKMACSSCKLVSYCSRECQMAHLAIHKSDCNDSIKSSNWKPGWVVEHRLPSFITGSVSAAEEFMSRFQDRLSVGLSLWGNVPAMDIINLANNERDPKTDLSLVFAASGDIRNIVATVNALGSDYSGKLTIILNDINPNVVSRNIALLTILGTIPDEVIAADMALHFWYSVFMPMEYRTRILSMMSTLLKEGSSDGSFGTPLGPHSTLSCLVSSEVQKLLTENIESAMSRKQAQAEYQRVRRAPSRVDYRDRMYMGLKPSHRLAFLQYRRLGIILPFGAVNAHFNAPNPSLFSGPSFFSDGQWLQTDYADPLASWDMNQIFSAGKAHGAQPEDVYGCLYFFLSDQLRAFARNIRQHRISFHVFSAEACALAQAISEDDLAEHGIPSATRFDRIDVSNIMDKNYVGIRDVLDAWGPLLAKTNNATLAGYFMNWAAFAEKGRVEYAGPTVLEATLDLLIKKNRLRTDVDPVMAVALATHDMNTLYDNSKVFSKYWKDHAGAGGKLQLRTTHKIVPPRLGTAVGANPSALPNFATEESWYRYTRLIGTTWTERFVELCHSKTEVRRSKR